MTIRQMQIFQAVCREGSVSQAAERLFIAQPSISRTLSELQDTYEIRLFRRSGNRLVLTDEGSQVLTDVNQLLAQYDQLMDKLQNHRLLSTLRLGMSIGPGRHFIWNCLETYKKNFPEVQTILTEDYSSEIEKKLLQNELDLGIIGGSAHSTRLSYLILDQDPIIAACSPDYPLSGKSEITLEDLSKEPLLLCDKKMGTREILDDQAAARGVTLIPFISTIDYFSLISYAVHGIGVTLLSSFLLEPYLRAGSLIQLPLKEDLHRSFQLAYLDNQELAPATQQFIALAKKLLQEHAFYPSQESWQKLT